MDIAGITNTNTIPNGTAVTPKKDLDKNAFLQLFTMQLKSQDPLKPMDASAMTSQMAQFSSLEQLTNINTSLSNMLLYQNSLQNVSATNMIGKQVTLASSNETHTVTGVVFENNQTYLQLDNGNKTQLGDVKAILGGV